MNLIAEFSWRNPAIFNGLEAALWILLGCGIFLAGEIRGLTRQGRWVLAASYIAFGISDIIEMRTGSWYDPPALLVFKGLCLLGIVRGLNAMWRGRTSSAADQLDPDSETEPDSKPDLNDKRPQLRIHRASSGESPRSPGPWSSG